MGVILGNSPQDRDTSGENIVSDEGVGPNSRDQLLFGDDPTLLGGEGKEHFHDFGLDVAYYFVPRERIELGLNYPFPHSKISRALFHLCPLSFKVLIQRYLSSIRKPSDKHHSLFGIIALSST